MTSKPRLTDVTLCCIDCAQPALAIRALQLSRAQCDFAASILLTHSAEAEDGIEIHRVPRITDLVSYSHFVLKRLSAHIATQFVLLIQWDGYVLDGVRWEDGFRQFDYIGAPWHWHRPGERVGNGGFSLRSRRLLDALEDVTFPPGHPEDDLIGRAWRPALERRGVRFADVGTARRFSVEHDASESPSFGFHGMFNFWRVLRANQLGPLLDRISPAAAGSWQALDLMIQYVRRSRWAEARSVLIYYERQRGTAATIEALTAATRHVGGGEVLRNAILLFGTRQS
jgi:hypothetical protein